MRGFVLFCVIEPASRMTGYFHLSVTGLLVRRSLALVAGRMVAIIAIVITMTALIRETIRRFGRRACIGMDRDASSGFFTR
jgi:hypothetical protein